MLVFVSSTIRMCVINRAFDYKNERGEACGQGSLVPVKTAIIRLKKIRFYKGEIKSGATFHISIGHHTIPATITLFTDTETEGREVNRRLII